MEKSEIMQNIKSKFCERLSVKDIDETKSLKDLGLDSLDVVELLLDLEDEYDIKFESDEMVNYKTVQDLFKGIESKL